VQLVFDRPVTPRRRREGRRRESAVSTVSDIWHGPPFPVEARQPGPDPERTSYRSFLYFTDTDGNTWLVQEVTTRSSVTDPATPTASPRVQRRGILPPLEGDRRRKLTPTPRLQAASQLIWRAGGETGMVTVDTIGKVRRAYWVQGRKIKAIARDLKLARWTVRRIVRGGPSADRQSTSRRGQDCTPVRGQSSVPIDSHRQPGCPAKAGPWHRHRVRGELWLFTPWLTPERGPARKTTDIAGLLPQLAGCGRVSIYLSRVSQLSVPHPTDRVAALP
jgi:hypothetical protein